MIPNSTRVLCLVLVTTVSTVAAAQQPGTGLSPPSSGSVERVAEQVRQNDRFLSDPPSQRAVGCVSSSTGQRSGDAGLGVMAVLTGLLLVLGARTRRMAG